MDVSVIICTYNRCESLRRTLDGFLRLKVTPGLCWELIVVDNNSNDNTKSVCESFLGQLPIRYVFEPCQGQSAARNRGIAEAKGSLLLFTDDDVDVDPNWVAHLWDASRRHPEAAFFGGKIIPRWGKPPPKWLFEHRHTCLAGVAMSHDRGEVEVEVTDREAPAVGANLALRSKTFGEAGVFFREDLGLRGNEQVRWEEFSLLWHLMSKGFRGLYVPTAIVHHRNSPERMTERYALRWYVGAGVSAVRLGEVEPGQHAVFGAPRYLWRQFLASMMRYGMTRFTRPSQVWVKHGVRMAAKWGNICEFRARARRRAS